MSTQPLPLAGIRVVDYSHFLAGPYLSRCLAAMGAEVIKVERPTAGDAGRAHPYFVNGQSGYFLQQNMGKQGLCVNLKDPRGLELMHKLTDTADVFVENYRPGALDKLGLGYAELSQRNPRLVYCSVSAYGHTGPDAAQPGFGLIAEAKSGAMAMIGVPGEPPPLFRIALADMYTGIHGVAGGLRGAARARQLAAAASTSTWRSTTAWCRCTSTRCSATRCPAARRSRCRPATTCRSRRSTACSPAATATS